MIYKRITTLRIYLVVFLSLTIQFISFCIPWISEGISDRNVNQLLYSLNNYNPPEKKIVVTVTARNVKDWYERNLGSIFRQEYSNYRVIYVDDCSTDGTPELVEHFIKSRKQQHRVILIKNKEWLSQMANHYKISHMCDDDEIIVNVDSDDWFKHEYALSLINKVYSKDPNVWVTCGGSQFYPNGQISYAFFTKEIIDSHTYRETRLENWTWWHPRTYYAWLFKQIKLQDLVLNSSFKPLTPSPDSAFMFPIFEMAGYHTYQIRDILYRWNFSNPLSQWLLAGTAKQQQVSRIIETWTKYTPLKTSRISPAKIYNKNKADLIFFANGDNLENNFVELVENMRGLNKIYVIHEDIIKDTNKFLEKKLPNLKYIESKGDLKQVLNSVLASALDHVILANNTNLYSRKRDISHFICDLERTFAVGFYLSIAQNLAELTKRIPEYAPLADNMAAWQFKDAHGDGKRMFSLDWVIYRKKDILEKLKLMRYSRYKDLERAFLNLNNDKKIIDRNIGLFVV